MFEIDEYVHAQGKIEPESETKILSHLEGGVIEKIFVKEGDVVQKDQVLCQLSDISSQASYQESLKTYYLNWSQIIRLKSQIAEQELDFPEEITNFSPELVNEMKDQYKSRMDALRNEKKILLAQLQGSNSELKDMRTRIINLTRLHQLSKERTEILELLHNKQLLSKTQYIQSKLDTANRKMDLESAQINIAKLIARKNEAKGKLKQVKLRYNTQDWEELKNYEARFIEATKLISAAKDRLDRTNIVSPVYGIVQQLFVHTSGAAVMGGREIMSITPLKDTLLIEANVFPQDIGFIHPGAPATIKVSAYDYSIYGGLDGVVETISPDAIQDPKDPNRSYFRVLIRSKTNTINYRGKHYTIKPGQTVQADIITAKRTIMQYIMKPIAKSLEDPMRER
jgi:adhesin transport system membrane fusion protein